MPSLANGFLCCGPSLFVSAAFSLSIVSSSLCNYVETFADSGLRGFGQYGVRQLGFWCYEAQNGNRYEYGSFLEGCQDQAFDSARGLGLTANILGFIVWLIYLFAGCIPFPPPVFLGAGFLAFVTTMFEGFKLWILRSSFCDDGRCNGITFTGCHISTGARCTIAAVVLWFVSTLMTCAHGKERMDAAKTDDEGDEPPREGDNKEDDNNKEGGE